MRCEVLIALGAFVGKDGRCWPSLATIGRIAGLDRRLVPRALGKLIAAGLVTKIGSVAGRSATYELDYEPTPDAMSALTPEQMSELTPYEVSPDGATDAFRDDKVTSPGVQTDTSRDAD